MIRRPTPTAELYAWHRAALADPKTPRHDGLPECGWFKTRLVKDGPWVPAKIWVERDIDPVTGELTAPEEYRAEVDGMSRDPAKIWTFLKPISRAEFDELAACQKDLPQMAATMARLDLTEGAIRP